MVHVEEVFHSCSTEGPCQTLMMEFFLQKQFRALNYFHKKKLFPVNIYLFKVTIETLKKGINVLFHPVF